MAICYYNGKYAPIAECSLPVTDLVIQRGVGTFESIRVYEGRTFAMAQHLERLAGSTEGAGIKAAEIIAKLPEIRREHPQADRGRDEERHRARAEPRRAPLPAH